MSKHRQSGAFIIDALLSIGCQIVLKRNRRGTTAGRMDAMV